MPMHVGLIRTPEFVGDTGAADVTDAAVNQQQLAVVTMQIAQPQAERKRVIETQLDAGGGHPVTIGLAHLQAAETIEQAAHPNAACRRTQQRLQQAVETSAVLHQIELEIDPALGALDGVEHGRKEPRPVYQEAELIVAAPGEYRSSQHHRAAPRVEPDDVRHSDEADEQRNDMKSLFPDGIQGLRPRYRPSALAVLNEQLASLPMRSSKARQQVRPPQRKCRREIRSSIGPTRLGRVPSCSPARALPSTAY